MQRPAEPNRSSVQRAYLDSVAVAVAIDVAEAVAQAGHRLKPEFPVVMPTAIPARGCIWWRWTRMRDEAHKDWSRDRMTKPMRARGRDARAKTDPGGCKRGCHRCKDKLLAHLRPPFPCVFPQALMPETPYAMRGVPRREFLAQRRAPNEAADESATGPGFRSGRKGVRALLPRSRGSGTLWDPDPARRLRHPRRPRYRSARPAFRRGAGLAGHIRR
jgi:hypothetical protein